MRRPTGGWRFIFLALLLIAQAPAPPVKIPLPQIPGVGPGDPRVVVNVEQPPWWAIGRVQTELGERCTGFLIGPSTALTAAHCLYYQRSRHYLAPSSVHFVTGYALGNFSGHARATAFRIAPGYNPLNEGASAGADWAVLTLDTPLGGEGHVLPLFDSPIAIGDPVVLAGYGQDREELMEADLACTVSGWTGDGADRDLMRHGCSGTSGTSGAPVLMQRGGRWIVVGLQIAAVVGRPDGLAVPAFSIKLGLRAAKSPS